MSVTVTSVTDSWDDIFTSTARIWRTKMYDQVFRQQPLLYWLERSGQKKTQAGGLEIVIPLMYGINNQTKAFEDWDTLNTTPTELHTASRWAWKEISTPVAISGTDMRKNMGRTARFNLLKARLTNATQSQRWWLNDLLHGLHGAHEKTFVGGESTNTMDSQGGTAIDSSGDDAYKNFNSLDHIVRSGWGLANNDATAAQSHVVGGITVTNTFSAAGGSYNDWATAGTTWGSYVNPWWMNYSSPGFLRLQRGESGGVPGNLLSDTEHDYAGDITATSYQALIGAMRGMYLRLTDGSEHPDLGLMGQELFEAYEACLMPLERYTDRAVGDAGFQNLQFKQMTMIFDHGLKTSLRATPTAATHLMPPLYMLNSDSLEWVVHPDADFEITPFVHPVSQDPTNRVAQLLTMGNLCCNCRSKNGVISCCNTTDAYTPA
jgi:hypothetical protein